MKWLPYIVLAILPSCASFSGPRTNYSEITNQVLSLLDGRKFAEARTLVQGKGAMCKGYNDLGNCYAGEYEDAEKELMAKIEFAEKCDAAISSADQSRPASISAANGIKTQLHQACTAPEFPDSWMPTIPEGYKARVASIDSRFGVRLASQGEPNPIKEAENRCKAGMRWGYMAQKKPAKTIKAIDPMGNAIEIPVGQGSARLKGEFQSGDKCEEGRLTDPEAVPDGTFLLNRCKALYVGAVIAVDIAKIDVMGGKPEEFGTKTTAYFSSLEKCQKARAEGYENQIDESLAKEFKKIGPAETSGRPRFIGECSPLRQVVCSPGSDEPKSVFLLE